MNFATGFLALLGLLYCAAGYAQDEEVPATGTLVVYRVRPSQTDPRIHNFDNPHWVVFDPAASATGQLAVFMPGTDGKPGTSTLLLKVIADQGYRVIGLEYDDEPAVMRVCPRDPDPRCSGRFRNMRIFGGQGGSPVANDAAETIVNRLTRLLVYLDDQHPQQNWRQYLLADGPDWSRILVCGLSQGAGMAAYIAKKEPVARVVLFSSPWDNFGSSRTLAPWLYEPSVTPPERWFAAYHRRENTASLIVRAYSALHIPPANIRVFALDIPPEYRPKHSDNPFHVTTIKIPAYEPDWRFLVGHSP